ncbi:MAG: TonB-dependent receptor [Gammaproteobacteria bacterium]|nr:TonB-dependent receptor [Gammaproteobacteria bacterium]
MPIFICFLRNLKRENALNLTGRKRNRVEKFSNLFMWVSLLCLLTISVPVYSQDKDTKELSEATEVETDDVLANKELLNGDEGQESPETDDESDSPIEEVVVTGSRLPQGDVTALVHQYSIEEIVATGATNLEEFFRTLPWHFSSINTQTSHISNVGDTISGDSGSPPLLMDLSTVNLRSLGSANTLVLLNGRRIAGFAGSETDIVNISSIPLDAIEKVEIQLDGGSAVYGSDAIAGVVNFITKTEHRGLTFNMRTEKSNTGADTQTLSLTGGTSWVYWGHGGALITLTTSEYEPVINSKTGYSSRDLRPLFGAEFDYRIYSHSQPGIVREWNRSSLSPSFDRWNPITYQLRANHNGVDTTIEDFIVNDVIPYDKVSLENGSHSDKQFVSINLRHEFFDSFEWVADVLYHDNASLRRKSFTNVQLLVPSNNAYNPFGRHMIVSYVPSYEHELGMLAQPYDNADSEQLTATLAMNWKLRSKQELELSWTESKSERSVSRYDINTTRSSSDPSATAFYTALYSSDPDVALNFFGNGTAQGGNFSDLLTETARSDGSTESSTYNILLSGELRRIWSGDITYEIGAERRVNRIRRNIVTLRGWRYFERNIWEYYNGLPKPSTRSEAYYIETTIPLVNSGSRNPWAKSLYITLQNRFDVHWTWGAAGSDSVTHGSRLPYSQWPTVELDYWDPDTGEYTTISLKTSPITTERIPNIVKVRRSKQSPRMGVRYQPVEELSMRASWSRAFQLPFPSFLFGTWNDGVEQYFHLFDPYDPDGADDVRVPYTYTWHNTDLEPEFSDTRSFSVRWEPKFLNGLLIETDYSTVDFQNRVEHSGSLIHNHLEIAFKIPEIIERNARGDITKINFKLLNVAETRNTLASARVSYKFGFPRLGKFESEIQYSRTLEDFKKYTNHTPLFSDLGNQKTGDRYQTHLSLYWERKNIRGNLFVRYRPGYLNDEAHVCKPGQVGVGRCGAAWDSISLDVGSLTIVDATFSYRFKNYVELNVAAKNVFNRDAPNTVRDGLPYDPTRWDARGRVVSLSFTTKLLGK